MVIFFVLFVVYVVIRIIWLLKYLLLNKHIWVEIHIKRNNQQKGIGIEICDPVFDIDEEDINTWMSLYKSDSLIKRVASFILLLLSIFVGFDSYRKTGSWNDITPILAGTVVLQFFNAMFEWVEIDTPDGMSPIVPTRIFAKKKAKNFMK